MTISILLLSCCFTSYHIGNSLTHQSLIQLLPDGETIDAHIDASQPLHVIWADPNGVDGVFSDPWPVALQQPWDAIILQPHDSFGSTLGTDVQAIGDFISISTATSYYVLQTWQRTTNWPSDAFWPAPVTDSLETLTTKQRDYFEHLMGRLDNVWMVPTGEVIYELEQRGFDPNSLYKDTRHLTNTPGTYIAAATLEATIKQQHPRLTEPIFGFEIEPILLADLRGAIWDVVTSHKWSGYSDFNRDGIIDGGDLGVWSAAYGSSRSGEDFLAWQRQFNGNASSPQSSAAAVPEPSSWLLLLGTITLAAPLRRTRKEIN